jgi:MOSC domain-containing protein YiiM
MRIKVLSVNLGTAQHIATKSGVSGIYKVPQTQPTLVDAKGVIGDTIIDCENHGGVDQAVYIYCQSDYDWWYAEEGLVTNPGHFGENLTISGMCNADAHIGARLVSESLILEITSPRTPCETFAARMNDKTFPKRFWASKLSGFYCRVISQGFIAAGQHMQYVPFNGPHISMKEWIENEPLEKLNAASRQRFLSTPLHYKARQLLSNQGKMNFNGATKNPSSPRRRGSNLLK